MNRVRMLRGLTQAAYLATLSLACVTSGCESQGAPPPAKQDPAAPQPAAKAVKAAVAAVTVPLQYGYVRLNSAIHPYARPENDIGRLDPEQRLANISLFFKLSPKQLRDRDALAAAQLDPKSPRYRQWLTPESYAARFGARHEDITRATAWLRVAGVRGAPDVSASACASRSPAR